MHDGDDSVNVSRRRLLRASAGTVAVSAVGTGTATASGRDGGGTAPWFDDCPDASLEPTKGHCVEDGMEGCADDHPATVELRSAVQTALEERYPDAGALIDAGYKPYFDSLDREDDSYSHWLNPEYIGDDALLDPERPESVLVDDETWRSIGVMFVATRNGDAVDPPAVYGGSDGDATTDDRPIDGTADPAAPCSPWHSHEGLPGRFAWWYYQQAYEREFADGGIGIPCRTPCMLHVWAVDHPESVYAHHAPPPEYRDRDPAAEVGFETDAEPGSDELGWDVLPDELVPERRPDEFAALVPGL
ncbi:hypothetical protein [Haloterrigena alkaliphila]|uniref:Uncharacterized protein n=1 Tax=Haloterrigena alkaliphila TaxID=2816475 RepID=A0A8A2VHX7_9EURY|nr:hypothetical protein [Haloterrigena alkaliphila]QSW97818.1 hypothetical protein J0X25_10335 [Haloterrigena alkaliphila]